MFRLCSGFFLAPLGMMLRRLFFFVVFVFLLPGNTLHSDRSIAHSQIFLLIRKQIKLNSYEILMVFFLFSSMSLFHHQLYGISLPFAREPSTPGSLNIFFFSFWLLYEVIVTLYIEYCCWHLKKFPDFILFTPSCHWRRRPVFSLYSGKRMKEKEMFHWNSNHTNHNHFMHKCVDRLRFQTKRRRVNVNTTSENVKRMKREKKRQQ